MGWFKNLAVKGLAGAAGAATLAITKNPALAATATQMVNAHGHKLVDPAVKALANHKFSFGSGHKLSARDIIGKVTGAKNSINSIMDGTGKEGEEEKEKNVQWGGGDEDDGAGDDHYEREEERGDEFGDKLGEINGLLMKRLKKNLKRKALREGRMGFHDQISHLGRKSKYNQYAIGYEK